MLGHHISSPLPSPGVLVTLIDDKALAHGQFLEERRLDLGLKWSEVAKDMERLFGVSVTPDYLSKIKRGRSPLSKVTLEVREALRQVLRIPTEEWEEATGLYTSHYIVLHRGADAGVPGAVVHRATGKEVVEPDKRPVGNTRSFRGPVRPRLEAIENPLEIPPALQEAIDRYGGTHPEMRIEANQRAVTSLNRYGGNNHLTPEDWLDIFMANRRWLVKP